MLQQHCVTNNTKYLSKIKENPRSLYACVSQMPELQVPTWFLSVYVAWIGRLLRPRRLPCQTPWHTAPWCGCPPGTGPSCPRSPAFWRSSNGRSYYVTLTRFFTYYLFTNFLIWHEAWTQSRFNVGPASQIVNQHQTSIGSMFFFCHTIMIYKVHCVSDETFGVSERVSVC